MKPKQFVFPVFTGILLGIHEFSNSLKTDVFPFKFLFYYGLFWLMVILGLIQLIRGMVNYINIDDSSRLKVFVVYVVIVTALLIHHLYRENNDKSQSLILVGQNKKIEGRESTMLDFKSNGSLKIIASYKFSDAYFWGSYKKDGDTLLLDINPDFRMGRKGLIKNNNFQFLDDTINNSTYYLIDISYRVKEHD